MNEAYYPQKYGANMSSFQNPQSSLRLRPDLAGSQCVNMELSNRNNIHLSNNNTQSIASRKRSQEEEFAVRSMRDNNQNNYTGLCDLFYSACCYCVHSLLEVADNRHQQEEVRLIIPRVHGNSSDMIFSSTNPHFNQLNINDATSIPSSQYGNTSSYYKRPQKVNNFPFEVDFQYQRDQQILHDYPGMNPYDKGSLLTFQELDPATGDVNPRGQGKPSNAFYSTMPTRF